MRRALVLALVAALALPAACAPPAPEGASQSATDEAAVFSTPLEPVDHYCRTDSGALIALGESDAAGRAQLTVVENGETRTEVRTRVDGADQVRLDAPRKSPVTLRLDPAATVEAGAFTPAVTAIVRDGAEEACAWRPRTRLVALSATRALEAWRDEAGALHLDMRDLGVASAPVVTLRNGAEETGLTSITLSFDQGEDRYIVHASQGESVRLARWRDGTRQSVEAFPMVLIGDDPDAANMPLRRPLPPSPAADPSAAAPAP